MYKLPTILCVCLATTFASATQGDDRLNDGHSDIELVAFTKGFCVATRRFENTDEGHDKLRTYIDPEYLKEHDLESGRLGAQVAGSRAVRSIEFADDRQTAICTIINPDGDKELWMLKIVSRDGKLYVDPGAAPGLRCRQFTLWTFRKQLDSF